MSSSSMPFGKYREYKIKAYPQPTNYHVIFFPEKAEGFSFNSDLTPPVSLFRSENENIVTKFGQEDDSFNRDELVSSNPKVKRRSQIITQFETAAQKALKSEEAAPWVLEDSEGRSYASRLEGGQQQKYVLLVNQGSEFRVLFVNKWYRFSPRLLTTSSLLSTPSELTETKSKEPQSKLEKFIMNKAIEQDGEEEPHQHEQADLEGLDYEDTFDDDDDDETKTAIEETKETGSKTALTTAGKEMRKTLRHLDKSNLYQSEEDDSDMIRQHSSSSEEEVEVLNGRTEVEATLFQHGKVDTQAAKKSPPIKRIKMVYSAQSPLLSEDDITSKLKDGPIKVKDLILHLKVPLKSNPANKELFKELIKKLCVVKLGSNSEEKWIFLKPNKSPR